MKHRTFYNKEHAQRYLIHSIIMLGDMPVRVVGVTSGKAQKNFNLEWESLDKKESGWVFSDYEDINMQPVPLGMQAHEEDSKQAVPYYISRTPARAWKIGLSEDNIKQSYIVNDASKYGKGIRFGDMLYSPSLANTIMGKYPTLSEAVDLATKVNGIKAFSRQFAVSGEGDLYFKTYGVPVGKLDKNKKPVLNEQAFFLKELLEQVVK